MTKNDALLPCPHCGKAGGILKRGTAVAGVSVYQACCSDASCPSMTIAESNEEAVSAWNTRHSPTPAPLSKGDEEIAAIIKAYKSVANGLGRLPQPTLSDAIQSVEWAMKNTGVIFFNYPDDGYKKAIEVIIQAALTPSPVAVDAKAGGAETYQSYHRIMTLLRNLEMRHGKCHPREDRACTHCNAEDDIKKLVSEYKGAPVYASAQQPAEDSKPQEVSVTELADSVRKAFSMWSNKDGENSREYAEVKQALAWIAHNYPNAVIVKDKA